MRVKDITFVLLAGSQPHLEQSLQPAATGTSTTTSKQPKAGGPGCGAEHPAPPQGAPSQRNQSSLK